MKRILIFFFIAVLSVFSMTSCSKYAKALKSPDWKYRYEVANEYFNKGDYYRALVLFEDLVPIIKGDAIAEKIQFNYAYCHFYEKRYLESAYYFRSFFDIYSRSELAEEALFMHSFSLYKQSPSTQLDQTSSREAIESFQGFMNRFPESEYAPRAEKIIAEMQVKLEVKAYDNARQYFHLRYHEAAVIAFENFRKDYPDSKMNPEAAFLRIKSQYEFAKKSFLVKQPERYQKVIEFYESFVDIYPESPDLKEAENIFRAARKEMAQSKKMMLAYKKAKDDDKNRKGRTSEDSDEVPEGLEIILFENK